MSALPLSLSIKQEPLFDTEEVQGVFLNSTVSTPREIDMELPSTSRFCNMPATPAPPLNLTTSSSRARQTNEISSVRRSTRCRSEPPNSPSSPIDLSGRHQWVTETRRRNTTLFEANNTLEENVENIQGAPAPVPPPASVVLDSIHIIQQRLSTMEERMRTFLVDYLMYKMSLVGSYAIFGFVFGILISFCFLYGPGSLTLFNYNSEGAKPIPINFPKVPNTTTFHKDDADTNISQFLKDQFEQYRQEIEAEATFDCHKQNVDCQNKIKILQSELSELSENMVVKINLMKRLRDAVLNLKNNNYFVPKSSLNFQNLLVLFGTTFVCFVLFRSLIDVLFCS